MAPDCVSIHEFEKSAGLLDPLELFLVVKSQDQLERRARLVDQVQRGEKLGRIRARPVAEGLLVKHRLPPPDGVHIDAERAELVAKFPEPRSIVAYEDGRYLLTEIGRVVVIEPHGSVVDAYTHPYFGFLHSVALDAGGDRILVTSSGYDAILELDARTKEETWRWFGWDHGFNPNEDGVYYANTRAKAEEWTAQGHVAEYVDPARYSDQGLVTAARTTHPNVAFYNPHTAGATIIASLGHGKLVEIDRSTSEHRLLLDAEAPVLHGIMPYESGWMVTDTMRGEFWLLDREFAPGTRYSVAGLPGKPAEVGEMEWLQLALPVGSDLFLLLDANRGVIVCDTAGARYEVFEPDPNWCLQDALIC